MKLGEGCANVYCTISCNFSEVLNIVTTGRGIVFAHALSGKELLEETCGLWPVASNSWRNLETPRTMVLSISPAPFSQQLKITALSQKETEALLSQLPG